VILNVVFALDGAASPSAAPGPDGGDVVKKILGSVSGIAIGLAELRNRDYGTGHGPATSPVGLGARHAHLAVNAAFTWCQLMLDTLADPKPLGANLPPELRRPPWPSPL
jgi:hypothetical protein